MRRWYWQRCGNRSRFWNWERNRQRQRACTWCSVVFFLFALFLARRISWSWLRWGGYISNRWRCAFGAHHICRCGACGRVVGLFYSGSKQKGTLLTLLFLCATRSRLIFSVSLRIICQLRLAALIAQRFRSGLHICWATCRQLWQWPSIGFAILTKINDKNGDQ